MTKKTITKNEYQQLLLQAQRESFLEWVVQNGIKNERGESVEFRKHLFLYDIYDDWTPRQAIQKSSQIGGSLMMVLKTFYAAGIKDLNVIYTLPSYDFVRKFVPEKVSKIVEQNPVALGNLIGSGTKDSLDQKQVGNRTIYFDSAFEHESKIGQTAKGIALTSDLNIHDEANRSSLSVIEQYQSRLDYSEYKGTWMFSNPTFPNVGVSAWWRDSDQKHWFIKCRSCGFQQYLEWEKNIDRERQIYVCQKCQKELTDENRRVGQWVRKWQNKDISGYWINQMMAPWKSAKELLALEAKSSKQHFYNFALGLPYAGSDVVIDQDLIMKNITTSESSKTDVCIGVDVGIQKHVIVGTPHGIFQIFKTEDWSEVENVFLKYDATMVIDALPDITVPRELVKKYRGRVFINYFREGMKGDSPIEFKTDKEYGVVQSDRTRLIEAVIDSMVKGETRFHLREDELGEYIEHWSSMYRYIDHDTRGNPIVRWESANGNDHFCFAHLYYLIAVSRASTGVGAVLREKGGRVFRGKESFYAGQQPAPSVEEFIGKPESDWRYT